MENDQIKKTKYKCFCHKFHWYVVPTVLYGCETWTINGRKKDELETNCLQTIIGVRWFDSMKGNSCVETGTICYGEQIKGC